MKKIVILLILLFVLLSFSSETSATNYQSDLQNTGYATYYVSVNYPSDNMSRGQIYTFSVTLELVDLVSNFVNSVSDLHDIKFTFTFTDEANRIIHEKTTKGLGTVNYQQRLYSTSVKIRPDNEFSDITLLYLSWEYRANIAMAADPYIQTEWTQLDEINISGDYSTTEDFPWLYLFLGLAGFIIIIVVYYYFIRQPNSEEHEYIRSISLREQLSKIDFERALTILMIIMLITASLTILYAGFNSPNDNNASNKHYFELKTSSTWERGKSTNIDLFFHVTNFGDYEDYHDIIVGIQIKNTTSILLGSTSSGLGRINPGIIGAVNSQFIHYVWNIIPANDLPDIITIAVQYSFRLNLKGGFDPKIDETYLVKEVNLIGSTNVNYSIISYEGTATNYPGWILGISVAVLFISLLIRYRVYTKPRKEGRR